jgi:hypothetical protein
MTIHLTDTEVRDMCAPLVQGAAMVRYLQRKWPELRVDRKPSGMPLISRAQFENLCNGKAAANDAQQPNWGARGRAA